MKRNSFLANTDKLKKYQVCIFFNFKENESLPSTVAYCDMDEHIRKKRRICKDIPPLVSFLFFVHLETNTPVTFWDIYLGILKTFFLATPLLFSFFFRQVQAAPREVCVSRRKKMFWGISKCSCFIRVHVLWTSDNYKVS
jgi:hypothetical protein